MTAFAEKQPNIVFILCDDLGYGDLGVTGHPYVKTPNIDGLARDGIQLTEAYMSAAWCGPSRAALMSGIYPARNFNRTHALDATAHYGKWHLGPREGGSSCGAEIHPAVISRESTRIFFNH
jgi:hypothetical protein